MQYNSLSSSSFSDLPKGSKRRTHALTHSSSILWVSTICQTLPSAGSININIHRSASEKLMSLGSWRAFTNKSAIMI